MDSYAPVEYLQSRDAVFFTPDVVFSNTVRSMVNINDEVTATTMDDSETIPEEFEVTFFFK